MVSMKDFIADDHGKKYADVVRDQRVSFQEVVDFFNLDDVRRRMEESETHHKRPPLAGAVVELEQLPTVKAFLEIEDAHTTMRFRQAIGVLVKLHMFDMGWLMDGKREEALGKRIPKQYVNTPSSLSKWITKARHYKQP